MSLKLYYDLLSQPSRALYIFLKVCNIPFEGKFTNLAKGEQHTPEYQKIHPFKKVPAVQHNGFNMIESVAILRYLCREFTVADHWYPKESKAQLKVDEYLEWQHHNTRIYCALYFRTKYLIPLFTGEPVDEKKVKQLEKDMKQTLDDLENVWLKDKNFLAGSKISIADIIGSCEVEQVRIAGYNPHEGRPLVAAWMKRVAEETSPHYQEAHVLLNKLVKKENAALCDQVAQMQENLMLVKEERLFLLRKLCQQQGDIDTSTTIPRSQSNNINIICSFNPECPIPKKTAKKRASTDGLETKSKAKRYNKTARKVVQLIPLDVHGRPIFPISLGDLTVYSLGEVVSDRMAYHTEDLIYPVGYCSTRVYANLRDIRTKSLYTCKILDGGSKPRFEIVSDNDLDQPLVGSTPDECHSKLLMAISPALGSIIPRGADFFGISHPTVQNLIQSTPGTRKLAMYKQQRFEVSKSQPMERGASPIIDEETDAGLGFAALHRHYALRNSYRIKEEPSDNDLLALQELLT